MAIRNQVYSFKLSDFFYIALECWFYVKYVFDNKIFGVLILFVPLISVSKTQSSHVLHDKFLQKFHLLSVFLNIFHWLFGKAILEITFLSTKCVHDCFTEITVLRA
jgi:hypothetical protein